MNCNLLTVVLSLVLATVTAAPAAAAGLPPVRVEVVDDATLATLSGKFYGANLLVGVRIDLVSTLSNPHNGSASATGSLYLRRVGNGFEVHVDTRSSATEGTAPPAGADPRITATGAGGLQIAGIGQISQIAGDGNSMANLTTIRFVPASAAGALDASQFNGQTASSSSAGAMTAHITFLGGGLQLGLSGPGATLGQQVSGGGGGMLQLGQIAGNGLVGRNQLQLQPLISAMPTAALHQLGVQQALAGLAGLGR